MKKTPSSTHYDPTDRLRKSIEYEDRNFDFKRLIDHLAAVENLFLA